MTWKDRCGQVKLFLPICDFSCVKLIAVSPILVCINKINETVSFDNNQWKTDWAPVQLIFTFQGMIDICRFPLNVYYNLKLSYRLCLL